jgi:glutamyl-tRNA synthetase
MPRFWHMPLLRNADKSKISKRKNPVSLIYYRQAGFLPQAMLNFLGLMGGGMPTLTEQEIVSRSLNTKETDIFSLAEMLEKFDFRRISLGGPVFDMVKLRWLNGEYLRKLTLDEFLEALQATVFSSSYLKSMVPLVQERIETLGEFGDLAGFLFQDKIEPAEALWLPKKRSVDESLVFVGEQLAVLETAVWEHDALDAALRKLGEEKQWSVKENFMLLRAILTGSTTSPPILDSMVVLGKARTLDRVRRFIEREKSRKRG